MEEIMNNFTAENIPAFAILSGIYEELDDLINSGNMNVSAVMKGEDIKFWIAGGALSDLSRGVMFKDIDIFSPFPKAVLARLKESDQHAYFEVEDRVSNFRIMGHTIQVVTGYSPASPAEIIDLFDFTAVCGVYHLDGFTSHPRFWQDNATKRLVINNLPKPLSTLERITKYCRKGFRCCPIGLSRVAKAINAMEIDWDNPKENEMNFYPDGTPRFLGID
jgi:hypothetical protein